MVVYCHDEEDIEDNNNFKGLPQGIGNSFNLKILRLHVHENLRHWRKLMFVNVAVSCCSIFEIQGCIPADMPAVLSEEHGRPLVDNTERNASALQRRDGWVAARGAADVTGWWARRFEVFGQLLEQRLRRLSACHVFRVGQGSLMTQMELTGPSFVLLCFRSLLRTLKKKNCQII